MGGGNQLFISEIANKHILIYINSQIITVRITQISRKSYGS